MRPQTRWLMHNCGVIDPDSIDHYIARGGYGTFIEAAQTDRGELIEVITGSTLKGHSGSFFSTGTKWGFLRDANASQKHLVCNADEGDPGAWVNRVLMESDPHSIIEGMLIGAYATGATRGWIYIRDEYPLAIERMRTRHRAGARARHHRRRMRSAPASSSTPKSSAALAPTSAATRPASSRRSTTTAACRASSRRSRRSAASSSSPRT